MPDSTRTLFMTGFPGFISSRLLPALLADRPYARVLLLSEKEQFETARAKAAGIDGICPVEVVAGDITKPLLGVHPTQKWRQMTEHPSEWWHLAALYRLDVGLDDARKVNVEGTRMVLEAAVEAAVTPRLHYVSTAYVSGITTGRVTENDLPEPLPENFKNHYERTKNEAEWLVRERMDELPVTIYRPAIVTGDSRTGETQKFDGPFMTIKYLTQLGPHLPVPRSGSMKAPLNIVPVDYLVAAMTCISRRPDSVGACFQIVDPNPVSSGELFDLVAHALGRRPARWTTPAALIDLLMRVGVVRRRIGLPREAVRYANHSVDYDCTNTQRALAGSGIHCPSVRDYVDKLVAFYQENMHREELHVPVD